MRWGCAGAVVVTLCAAAGPSSLAAPSVYAGPVPRAVCGPGSMPETGAQGRVSAADVSSGRAAKGYTCNTRVIGHLGQRGVWKTLRYVDRAGRACAYYDTPQPTGVFVLDMRDPRHPVHTDTLTTPAMRSPHESLLLDARRGLLVAAMGTQVAAPGFVDVYDVTQDCRHPRLDASFPSGVVGHESGLAPDGRTFYVTSPGNRTIAAVDLTDPTHPALLGLHVGVAAHGVRLRDDGKVLYVADTEVPGDPSAGLTVMDVSQVQRRLAGPQMSVVSHLTWPDVSIPQVAIPVTIHGHHVVVEVDEYSSEVAFDSSARVGTARIIDVEDPRRPFVVSNIRLQVNTASARQGPQQDDPGAHLDTTGYTAHYCSVPREVDPGIVACTFIRSGLRVFDIHDPARPREVAYFNAPNAQGGTATSAPAFDSRARQIWFTDSAGFWVVQVTNRAWWDDRRGE